MLDREGVYFGGAIAPGIRMRYRSMHEFTARLPLVEPQLNPPLVGDSTQASMRSGVNVGVVAEVAGMIEKFAAQYPELQVVITGGDLIVFEGLTKNSIFADPDLLLKGLNFILTHYVDGL